MYSVPLNIHIAADGAIEGTVSTGFSGSPAGTVATVCDSGGRTVGAVNVYGSISPRPDPNSYNVTISLRRVQSARPSEIKTFYGVAYYDDTIKALSFTAKSVDKARRAA